MRRIAKHGGFAMYVHHKCRCRRCVANWNAYQAERYHARKAEKSQGEDNSTQPLAVTQPNDLHLQNQIT